MEQKINQESESKSPEVSRSSLSPLCPPTLSVHAMCFTVYLNRRAGTLSTSEEMVSLITVFRV